MAQQGKGWNAPQADNLIIWTIYKSPRDYPGRWVLRGHEVGSGTSTPRPHCIVSDTYTGIIDILPPGLHRLPRDEDDDPAIYESWA